MDSMPKVSVLVPTFNRARFILDAIESVFSQTYTDWELIVVDDGSDDETAALLKPFKHRLTYIFQSNHGCAAAQNRAFDASCGEYVTILHSDDSLLPNGLQILASFLDQHSSLDFVYSNGYATDEGGQTIDTLAQYRPSPPYQSALDSIVTTNFIAISHSAMIRRCCLEKLEGPFDARMWGYEDWDLAIRLIAGGAKFAYLNELTCTYRMHSSNKSAPKSSISAKRRDALISNRFKVLESSFFTDLSLDARKTFFYSFLLNHLADDAERAREVIESSGFRSLPNLEQSQLLYYLGVASLVYHGRTRAGLERLKHSLLLNPYAFKPRLAIVLHWISPVLLNWTIEARKRFRHLSKDDSRPTQSLPVGGGSREVG
jgi:glycosyltransferase involved in cell wall biosynthesis